MGQANEENNNNRAKSIDFRFSLFLKLSVRSKSNGKNGQSKMDSLLSLTTS